MDCRFLRKRTLLSRFEELKVWESLNFERSILRTAVYLIAVVIALLCSFFNIVYGVQFSASENRRWLTSVGIALVAGTPWLYHYNLLVAHSS